MNSGASFSPDETKGFRKKENQLIGYEAIRDFCDRHLKNAPIPSP